MKQRIVLGTRGSELALIQSRIVEAALRERWPELEIETSIIRTSGDEAAEPSLEPVGEMKLGAAGRKGLFTAEIEKALIGRMIDVAVHSAKDLPSVLGSNTSIAAALPRAHVSDVLVSVHGYDLDALPRGALVATGSVRRRHQLRWKRPDLKVVDLSGNVPTRLRKLIGEGWHGAVLARAGLERLGLSPNELPVEFEGTELRMSILPPEVFVPAGGQGIIALQVRAPDEHSRRLVEAISDPEAEICLRAEREFLRLLQADCDQPVGVCAIVNGHLMSLHGQVFEPGASCPREAIVKGKCENAEALAAELLERINGH